MDVRRISTSGCGVIAPPMAGGAPVASAGGPRGARTGALLPLALTLLVAAAIAAVRLGGTSLPAGAGRAVLRPLTSAGAADTSLSAAIGARLPYYRIRRAAHGEVWTARGSSGLRMRFDHAGLTVSGGAGATSMSLVAIGYGDALHGTGAAGASAARNRLDYRGRGVESWYVNGPAGLEQGFTIASRPGARASGTLTLSLAVSGDGVAVAPDRRSATLSLAGGGSLLYGGLLATDARGRALPSWLEARSGRLLIRVRASDARYPLHIDPLIETSPKLTGAEATRKAQFGGSLAVSADGSTAVVGSPAEASPNSDTGGAWVFVRSGSGWVQQGSRLFAGVASEQPYFGASVAISADGDTVLVGSPEDHSKRGSATVFVRSGSTWTQQGERLTPSGAASGDGAGSGVALSGDGNTAIVGSRRANKFAGAAAVFTRSGSVWSQQAALAGAATAGGFGASVAISSDGTTALIGSPGEGAKGAARVFARSGSEWTAQGPALEGEGEMNESGFGESVALSAHGDTAIVGGGGGAGTGGGAWVFVRSGESWGEQGPKLEGSEASGGSQFASSGFGHAVAVSGDGNTALVGGSLDENAVGAVWVFDRSGSSWTEQGKKITAAGEVGPGDFGASVALSQDGSTGLASAPFERGEAGAVWTLANVTVEPGQPPVEASPPRILGTAEQGQPLAEEHGAWGGEPTSYSLQWLRCDASGEGCAPIEGAEGQSYSPVPADVGKTIRVEETATREELPSVGAASAPTAQVHAPLPPEFGHCVSVPAKTGGFGNSKCSATGGKADYEWEPGMVKSGFALSGSSATFETETRLSISCSSSAGVGSYSHSKQLQATITFSGCGSSGQHCSSEGAGTGQIVTHALDGSLVWLSKAAHKTAFQLEGADGVLAGFSCGTQAAEIEGSVLLPLKGYSSGVKVKLKASRGVQKPLEAEDSLGDPLRAQLEWGRFSERFRAIGLTTTLVLTGEEPLQIDTVV